MRRGVLVAAVFLTAMSCGGGGSSTPTQPTPPAGGGGTGTTTITINASGADLRAVTLTPGSRVRFVNNDTRAHEMNSDPHPSHENCPELNQVGFLNPGQTRESGNLVDPGNCGFHDHINPGTQTLHGTITVR
jgi:plastocyanin